MSNPIPSQNTKLCSQVSKGGSIEVWFEDTHIPQLAEDDVLIEVEATPINPSDMPVIFGLIDVADYKTSGEGFARRFSMPLGKGAMAALAGRVGDIVHPGLEGCGTVIAAGTSNAAQALIGQRVSCVGPEFYAQYKTAKAQACLPLPAQMTAEQGASAYINPLTALCMIQTAKREGHKAMIFSPAGSNLGAMMHKLCEKEGLGFIGIVRSDAAVEQLKAKGVEYACNLKSPHFHADLTKAITATGATLAFDSIAGGNTINELLFCMEQVAKTRMSGFSRYGSSEHKQVYIYGGLDASPTILNRNFGMAFGIGGWLLFHHLQKCTPEERAALNQQVVDGLATIFATEYAKAISLADMLNPANFEAYMKRGTGQKYLVMPKDPAQL